jgi:hypothetical protein
VDTLFVDEAGQLSLANVLAAAARRVSTAYPQGTWKLPQSSR